MQSTGDGVSFLEAAQQGMFAINTEAANQITASIAQIQDLLYARLTLIDNLTEQAMLGGLTEAQAISKLDTLVAGGDSQSLDYVMQRFTKELDNLNQVVQICMRTYEHDDAQAAQGLRSDR